MTRPAENQQTEREWLEGLRPDEDQEDALVPRCPHCGARSMTTLYASNFHEHTCENLHVWRVY